LIPDRSTAPDVPHAANSLYTLIEKLTVGSGVGFNKEPPVILRDVNIADLTHNELATAGEVGLEFVFDVGDDEFDVRWQASMYPDDRMLVHVPMTALPEGSKESFIRMLEFAEEDLHCREIYAQIEKSRPDRAQLIRAFTYFGFVVLPPGVSSIREDPDAVTMVYRIE